VALNQIAASIELAVDIFVTVMIRRGASMGNVCRYCQRNNGGIRKWGQTPSSLNPIIALGNDDATSI
jgi:hypothetical protein